MSLKELLMETARLKRDIDEQLTLIQAFMNENNGAMDLVQSEISGGSKGYDQQMCADLVATRQSLSNAQQTLLGASNALHRVTQI